MGILGVLYYYCSRLPGSLLLTVADCCYNEAERKVDPNVMTAMRYMARFSSDKARETNLVDLAKYIMEVAKGGVLQDEILRLFPQIRALYRCPEFYEWTAEEMAYTSATLGLAAFYAYDRAEEHPKIDFGEIFLPNGMPKASGIIEEQDGDTIYSLVKRGDSEYHFLSREEN